LEKHQKGDLLSLARKSTLESTVGAGANMWRWLDEPIARGDNTTRTHHTVAGAPRRADACPRSLLHPPKDLEEPRVGKYAQIKI
jgi:hypothetical protein